MKKIVSFFLAFLLLVTPVSGVFAGDTIIGGSAGHYQSSIDRTFYPIPTDGRNLENFVFTDTDFHYKHYADPEKDYFFTGAKISTKMNWFVDYFNYPDDNIGAIHKTNFSPFLVIVDPSKWDPDPDAKFGIPIFRNTSGYEYFYLDMKIDENQNYCVYLSHNKYNGSNIEGKYEYKLENTCHMRFLDREPFFLFFQIWQNISDYPSSEFSGEFLGHNDFWEGVTNIRYTTNYKTTQGDDEVMAFYPTRHIAIHNRKISKSTLIYENTWIYRFRVQGQNQRNFYHSFSVENFQKFRTSQMYRTYSYNFQDYFIEKYDNENCGQNGKLCRFLFPGREANFLDSFVYSFAAQYFGSPTYSPEHTYVGTGALFNTGFLDTNFSECSGLDVGCYLSKIGKIIGNGFNFLLSIPQSIGKYFFEGLKLFVNFLKDLIWTPIYEAFEPVVSFFISLFSKIKDGEIINREFLSKQITLNCEVNYNYSITDDERQNILNIHSGSAHFFNNNFLNGIFSTFRFINPVIPSENSQICTYSGMKEVTYRNNSWIDILFVMLFGFLTLLLFYRRT